MSGLPRQRRARLSVGTRRPRRLMTAFVLTSSNVLLTEVALSEQLIVRRAKQAQVDLSRIKPSRALLGPCTKAVASAAPLHGPGGRARNATHLLACTAGGSENKMELELRELKLHFRSRKVLDWSERSPTGHPLVWCRRTNAGLHHADRCWRS